MTRARPTRTFPIPAALLALTLLLAGGCGGDVNAFAEPANVREKAIVARRSPTGFVVATFTTTPIKQGAPPDGIRMAMLQALGRYPCSAATFYWLERDMAERWITEQLDARRRSGHPRRLILAGHGLGATEAAEIARNVLANQPDCEIIMLVTVDAVKPGKIGSAAGVTGAVIGNQLPGVTVNFIAYDAAPAPDGGRFLAHINYYQKKNVLYHGEAMSTAENHFLDDWTGLLNFASSDDFAIPYVASDLKAAFERASR